MIWKKKKRLFGPVYGPVYIIPAYSKTTFRGGHYVQLLHKIFPSRESCVASLGAFPVLFPSVSNHTTCWAVPAQLIAFSCDFGRSHRMICDANAVQRSSGSGPGAKFLYSQSLWMPIGMFIKHQTSGQSEFPQDKLFTPETLHTTDRIGPFSMQGLTRCTQRIP